jgi:F420-dependent oxidoreductase-like protein
MIKGVGVSLASWREQAFSPEVMRSVAPGLKKAGVDSLWSSEWYGADCFTPLSWWGAHAPDMGLGTVVAQLAARTPAATAMAAMTLDMLCGGRFVLGLGVSGPQVVEGWYGVPFTRPLAWTREYVEILRAAMARDRPLEYAGEVYQLPLRSGTGLGKAIRSSLRGARSQIPIYIGAEGPRNIALAAEIADGWLATNISPADDDRYRDYLEAGFGRRSVARDQPFEVVASIRVVLADTVQAAADQLRDDIALYVGGMGARSRNFHLDAFTRLGFGSACQEIQAKYLASDRAGAALAVPTEMIEAVCLVGPASQVRQSLARWNSGVADRLVLRGSIEDCLATAAMCQSLSAPAAG